MPSLLWKLVSVLTFFIGKIYKDYTKITEVKLSAFAYRLFHEDFAPIISAKLGKLIFSLDSI